MSYPSASSGSLSFVSGTSARHSPVPPSPALLQLLRMKLDCHVIRYVVDCVCSTVDYALGYGRSALPARLAKFSAFRVATLLVALAYIARVRPHLCIDADEWAYERVFLGALVCASKYTSDVHLKNAHWALCTGVFSKHDVGRIEREFLDVVEWQLGIREADLLDVDDPPTAAVPTTAPPPALAPPAPTLPADLRPRARPRTAASAAPPRARRPPLPLIHLSAPPPPPPCTLQFTLIHLSAPPPPPPCTLQFTLTLPPVPPRTNATPQTSPRTFPQAGAASSTTYCVRFRARGRGGRGIGRSPRCCTIMLDVALDDYWTRRSLGYTTNLK
ncbi:hypothetical protein DFH06DRAFT_1376796 [Mycena polygramma]|nr:hypothetical protein DFH06DRAFT_1376796 [Mycena polygramma]